MFSTNIVNDTRLKWRIWLTRWCALYPFTAAFLKYPTPAVVCFRILSAALELCSSVLPSNLVKRELDFSIALSLDFLRHCVACVQAVVLRFIRFLYVMQERSRGNGLLDMWNMCYDALVIGIALVCEERWQNARGTNILIPRIYHACGTCLLVKRRKRWLE